jgi:hypothetical protein
METQSKHIHNIELVEKFRKILFFQISIPPVFFVLYFVLSSMLTRALILLGLNIFILLLVIIIGAAVIFTPFMIYVLIKEKHFGWVITFFIMVVLPYPLILLINYENILLTAWLLLPVIVFYLYCFLIKYSIDEWLKEYYAEQQLAEQKLEWEEKKKEWLI